MAFIAETFTFSYITCTFGPELVGLIMIFFGIANSFGCIVLSYLQAYVGRIMIFAGGFLINFILVISLLFEWIYPNPNKVEWYLIFVIFWGIGDSIWQRALMGKYNPYDMGHVIIWYGPYRKVETSVNVSRALWIAIL